MPPAFYDVLAPLIADEPHAAAWMLGLTRERRCTTARTLLRPGWPRWPDPHDADAQVRLEFADGSARIVVCKVLADWDEQIRYSLPAITGFAFEEHRLPVSALLVCATDALARRYRQGVDVGPDSFTAVTAVGPAEVPGLVAEASPWCDWMAVVSAALGEESTAAQAEDLAAALDRWLDGLDPAQAVSYAEGLLQLLAEEQAQLLRAAIGSGTRTYHAAMRTTLNR
ncbi:hypothetical protein [Glycomyces sp. NRRL B-16210]|uniref:hypothetical protein n=1 Tax=Glycomyces sp. NRRL B-16210 TaxID=1463821 RepID=UPI0004BF76F0|nr:hypothetical protein [Glycomyces sp. NRRL B-16210]